MAHEVPTGLRRIAQELRAAARDHGRRDQAEQARAELARLWAQIEDVVDRRLGPAARGTSRETLRDLGTETWGTETWDTGAWAARDAARDAAWRVRAAAQRHPLAALGIAVVATWAVTSLLRARR